MENSENAENILASRRALHSAKSTNVNLASLAGRKTGIVVREEKLMQDPDALDNVEMFWNAALTSPELSAKNAQWIGYAELPSADTVATPTPAYVYKGPPIPNVQTPVLSSATSIRPRTPASIKDILKLTSDNEVLTPTKLLSPYRLKSDMENETVIHDTSIIEKRSFSSAKKLSLSTSVTTIEEIKTVLPNEEDEESTSLLTPKRLFTKKNLQRAAAVQDAEGGNSDSEVEFHYHRTPKESSFKNYLESERLNDDINDANQTIIEPPAFTESERTGPVDISQLEEIGHRSVDISDLQHKNLSRVQENGEPDHYNDADHEEENLNDHADNGEAFGEDYLGTSSDVLDEVQDNEVQLDNNMDMDAYVDFDGIGTNTENEEQQVPGSHASSRIADADILSSPKGLQTLGVRTGRRGRPKKTFDRELVQIAKNVLHGNSNSDGQDGEEEGKLRASHRRRFKPFEFWKSERIKYGRRESSAALRLPAVLDVIKAPPDAEEQQRQSRASANVRRQLKLRGYKERKEASGTVYDAQRNKEVQETVMMNYENVRAKRVRGLSSESPEFLVFNAFPDADTGATGGASFGLLVLPKDATKPNLNAGEFTLRFFVHSGIVRVTIHKVTFVATTACEFIVPQGNQYEISNIHTRESKLYYVHLPGHENIESTRKKSNRAGQFSALKDASNAPALTSLSRKNYSTNFSGSKSVGKYSRKDSFTGPSDSEASDDPVTLTSDPHLDSDASETIRVRPRHHDEDTILSLQNNAEMDLSDNEDNFSKNLTFQAQLTASKKLPKRSRRS